MRNAAMLFLFALLAITADAIQNGNSAAAPGQNPTQPNGTQPANIPAPADQNNANIRLGPATAPGGDVPATTEMRATLDTPLSSKTSQTGDRFTATVVQPVSGRNGVVIPAGARVEGEVSESEQSKTAALRGKGVLNLRLRDIVLASGQTVPLVASLVSVNSTNGTSMQKANNEGQIESGSRRSSVTRDVDAGAGAGIGPVFGRPLRGLAIGALAGGGYVLATNGKEVNLPAQTGLVIRLDQGLSLH